MQFAFVQDHDANPNPIEREEFACYMGIEECPVFSRCDNKNCLVLSAYTRPETHYSGNAIKALVRDGFTCTVCGSAERLEAHHKDKNRKNNSLSNLETVCSWCHKNVKHGKALKLLDALS